MILIFGTEYIQVLDNKKISERDSEILRVIIEMRFTARSSSVCAIKVIGIGWNTSWFSKVLCQDRV
jgi:hypothetical protein